MKKVFKLRDLDCANCAAKMEAAIQKIHGVESATVNFMTQKLTIEAAGSAFEQVLSEAERAIRRVEPGCALIK